jgi:tetratricopeptide (TPR) repeat protein
MQLHMQGRAHGQEGRFEEALKHFQQAREAAPSWLLPQADIGFTYLLMGDDARALKAYEELDALAPQGYANSKQVLDSLRREKDGRVPVGTYRKYMEVLRLRDLEEIRKRLKELTRAAPGFIPGWQELALTEQDPREAEKLVAKALALEPDLETRGHLLLHQARLLQVRGEREAGRKQYQALLNDPAMPPSVKVLAKEALSIPENILPGGAKP